MKKELEQFNEQKKKHEQELSNKERRIAEFEMKIKTLENEGNELKGDVTGYYHVYFFIYVMHVIIQLFDCNTRNLIGWDVKHLPF